MKDTTKEDPLKDGGSLRPISDDCWRPGNLMETELIGDLLAEQIYHIQLLKIRQETMKN